MNLIEIAGNIEQGDDEIYYAKKTSAISYPAEGNEAYFQIEKDSFWFKHRNKVIIETVRSFSPLEIFFDIGGGNGYVAKGLQDAGIETVLIEPGSGALNAKARGLKNVVRSTLQNAGFQVSSIPAVGLFDVVEHIEDDLHFLKEINHYMKTGGVIYITVPAFNGLWSNEDDDAGHFRRYSLRQIKEVLSKAGYKIEYETYIFSILPIPVFLFRSIPSKLGLHKKSADLNKHKKEHAANKGFMTALLNKIWAWEFKKIKNKRRIPVGGSCFVVGRKI